MTAFKAGVIQTNVSNEMAENVAFVRAQAKAARDAGADFVMTPENTGLIGANRAETLAKAQYAGVATMNYEAPLTRLVWITSVV